MMEREKKRILDEKAELRKEREAINEAKKQLESDNSVIAQAKSMINQKIKKIMAVDGQVAASLEQIQFSKLNAAKEIEPTMWLSVVDFAQPQLPSICPSASSQTFTPS